MEIEADDTLKFVLLLEDYKILLNKSQSMISKKKKQEALSSLTEKWAVLTNKNLKEAAIMKKISNLKVRTNKSVANGQALTDWQQKMLEFSKDHESKESVPGEASSESNDSNLPAMKPSMAQSNMKAEDIVAMYESEKTKLLSNEQLQRIILLQQVEVLTLKRKKILQDLEINTVTANSNVGMIGDHINLATAQVLDNGTIQLIDWQENNLLNDFEV